MQIGLAGPTQPHVEIAGVEVEEFADRQTAFVLFLGLALPRSVSTIRVVRQHELGDRAWVGVGRVRTILYSALKGVLGDAASRLIPPGRKGSLACRLAITGPFTIDSRLVAYEPPRMRSVAYPYREARIGPRGLRSDDEVRERIRRRPGELNFRSRIELGRREEKTLGYALASVGLTWQPDPGFASDLTHARLLFRS